MDGVGLVRGSLRAGRRAVGAGLPRLRALSCVFLQGAFHGESPRRRGGRHTHAGKGRPIRRRRVPLLRAAGPVADADDAAHVGADVHADDAVADQRAFHSSAVSRTFVQADADAFGSADAGSLRATYAVADAGAEPSTLESADVRALCATDAAAQSAANAGAVASASSGANAEADARTHGYAWKSDRGSSLLPYAAAIACTDAAAHAGAVAGTVAGADASSEPAADARADVDADARTNDDTDAQALARAVSSPEPQADARPHAEALARAHAPAFAGADDRAYDGTDAAS